MRGTWIKRAATVALLAASGFVGNAYAQAETATTDAPADASTRSVISFGETVTGALAPAGDADWYRATLQPGRIYSFTLNAVEGSELDPMLRIVNAAGEELALNDDHENLNSFLEFIAPARGTYYIEARGFGDAAAGAYTLAAQQRTLPPDNAGNSASSRARIAVGGSAAGALDYPGDLDWFRIPLQAGQSYRFALDGAGGENTLADPMLVLYGPDGAEVARDDDGGEGLNAYLEYAAATSGNYHIEARSFADSSTGAYTLRAAAGDIPASVETDAILSADGDYREGMLAPAGDRDWYRLTLTEGQSVRIGLDSPPEGGLGDPLLVLHGPDGAELAQDDDGGEGLNSWLEFTAPAAGAVYVEARGFADEAEGRYTINVIGGEIGDSIETSEVLAANGEPRESVITGAEDADWFSVEMIEGRTYRFNLESAGDSPLGDPTLRLLTAEGTEVAADDDGGTGTNAYLTYLAPTSGSYYAAVSGYEAGEGRYSLRVSDTDVPGNLGTDEVLVPAQTDERLSSIEFAGDLDWYRVELEAGVTYVITVSGEGDRPLADPFLSIFASEGQSLTSDDDSGPGRDALLRFTPTASDSYFLQASGLGGATGGYLIAVTRPTQD